MHQTEHARQKTRNSQEESQESKLPSSAAICSSLRQSAMKATEALTLVSPGRLKRVVGDLLRELCLPISAMDIHLFRIRLDDSDTGIAGIHYQSARCLTDEQLQFLSQFQFRLFSSDVQKCLLADDMVMVRKGTNSGGRMVTGLMKELACDAYVLCPLQSNGRLKGILGIACHHTTNFPQDRDFLEMLKLNGAILLNHVNRVRLEKTRSSKLRRWRSIADQACDFAVSIDRRGVLFETTPFGMGDSTPVLDGLRLEDVIPRGFHREVRVQITRAIQTMKARTCEFQIALGVQGPRWYLARIEPAGTTPDASVTLYLTDNNPDKQLAVRNLELTEQLDRASRLSLLGQMSTEFAHQLNQPLQAILNYCNTMQRRIRKGTATEAKTVSSLANIEKAVLHSAEIIQRIRDFVKFRSLRIEHVPLEEVVDPALMMVMPTVHGKNGELTGPEGMAGIRVAVDSAQTTHVLVNLIVNALDACGEAGLLRPRVELRVSLDVKSPKVRLTVTDNGPGLPQDDPERVFRKFYSSKDEGLGMGLAISKDVCESQGGNLTARNNRDGTGCTFTVTLPLAGSEGTETAELPTIPGGPTLID